MKELFEDRYFSFLLSGDVGDFEAATEAFRTALQDGVSRSEIQASMDESRERAELLCLMVEPMGRGD